MADNFQFRACFFGQLCERGTCARCDRDRERRAALVAELRRAIEAKAEFPEFVAVLDDGACCLNCAEKNFARIAQSTNCPPELWDGWGLEAVSVNFSAGLNCSDCNTRIPSAYWDAEEPAEDPSQADAEAMQEAEAREYAEEANRCNAEFRDGRANR